MLQPTKLSDTLVYCEEKDRIFFCRGNSCNWDRDEQAAKRSRRSLVLAENADDDGHSLAVVRTPDTKITVGAWRTKRGMVQYE